MRSRPTFCSSWQTTWVCNLNNDEHIYEMTLNNIAGFNDVSWHNRDILTPNMDALVKGGIALEHNYVQPICTPTRSALMTGYYPIHTGRQARQFLAAHEEYHARTFPIHISVQCYLVARAHRTLHKLHPYARVSSETGLPHPRSWKVRGASSNWPIRVVNQSWVQFQVALGILQWDLPTHPTWIWVS